MLAQLTEAVSWRCRLLGAKVSGKMDMVPWPIVWGEVSQRRELQWNAPTFEPAQDDPAAGLQQMKAGDERYWVPSGTYSGGLDAIYKEVFNPDHPHHYEFGGCRIQAGDVVIDAGACEGFFTRFALARGARVIAVEPYSVMADALLRTFAREVEAGQLIVRRAMLTDRDGEGTLGLNPLFPFEAHAVAEGSCETAEQVEEVTLDRLVEETGWGRCDFVKMDIEGQERPAVAGAAATLRRYRPCLSIAVYHEPSGFRDIAADLARVQLNYTVAGKGLTQLRGDVWRPMMLHAWAPRDAANK